jgi:hypothetical protein
MKRMIIPIVAALLPTLVAAAELPKKTTQTPQQATPPRPMPGNPCAAYGAGFVKVEGSSTCVKIGGSVSVEAGGSR